MNIAQMLTKIGLPFLLVVILLIILFLLVAILFIVRSGRKKNGPVKKEDRPGEEKGRGPDLAELLKGPVCF